MPLENAFILLDDVSDSLEWTNLRDSVIAIKQTRLQTWNLLEQI